MRLLVLILMGLSMVASTADAQSAGRITGLGGVFIKSTDPARLQAWYRDVLGVRLESWGGAILPSDAPDHPPFAVWSVFPADSDYFAPSPHDFMLNFAVDDLDAFLRRLESKGVAALRRDDSDPSGRFAWVVDPDGHKIELWQPKR